MSYHKIAWNLKLSTSSSAIIAPSLDFGGDSTSTFFDNFNVHVEFDFYVTAESGTPNGFFFGFSNTLGTWADLAAANDELLEDVGTTHPNIEVAQVLVGYDYDGAFPLLIRYLRFFRTCAWLRVPYFYDASTETARLFF